MRKSGLWMRHKLFIRVSVRLLASDNVVDSVLHKCTFSTAEGDGATVPCCVLPGYRLGRWQTVFWHKGARLSLARSTRADRERTAGKSHRICELRPAQQRRGGLPWWWWWGGGTVFMIHWQTQPTLVYDDGEPTRKSLGSISWRVFKCLVW